MSNLAPVLPTISGSATVPIANQETTILILQEQQQHPLSPTTLALPKQQSPIHKELQTIPDHHRNEIISINQLNLTNQKDPSLPSLVSKLATITCTAISSQLSPTKQLAAHRLFSTTTIPADELNDVEKPFQRNHLLDSLIEKSSQLSSPFSPTTPELSNETTFTTSVTFLQQQQQHQPTSYDSHFTLCENQNDGIKDDDDDVFTWKPTKINSNIDIQLSTIINDTNEVTNTTTISAEEPLSQPKLNKPIVSRTPKISELTSSSLENDDENKCSSPAGGNLSLSLSPPVNRRREMPALRGPYVSL